MPQTDNSSMAFFGRRRRLRAALCAQRESLYRIAWSWCHDSSIADDLVQETLARAMSKLDKLRDEDRLFAWATQILANLHRDQFRRVTPQNGLDADQLVASDDPEQAACAGQLVVRTRAAIAALGDDQRQVMTLVDVAEFSYAETATILDVPVGTVMSRLSRARQRMRQLLEQRGVARADVVPLRRQQ